MQVVRFLIALFLLAPACFGQYYILWRQSGGKLVNMRDSVRLSDVRKVGTYYRFMLNGEPFWLRPDSSQGSAPPTSWGSITGTISAQTDLQAAFDGKLATSATAANSALLQSKDTIWVKAQGGGNPEWVNVQNKPTTFPPDAHYQAWSTITDPPTIPVEYDSASGAGRLGGQVASYYASAASVPAAYDSAPGAARVGGKVPDFGVDLLAESLAVKATSTALSSHTGTADAHLPVQTGQSGKFLTTNGTATSWGTPVGGGGATLDAPDRYNPEWWIQPNAGLTTIANVGFATAPTARGTATALRDTSGYYLNYASAATIDSAGGWFNGVYTMTSAQENPILSAQIKTGAAAADTQACRIWVCWASGYLKAAADTSLAIAGFRFVPGTAGGWSLYTNDASGTGTATGTGVLIALNRRYRFKVCVYSSNTATDSVVGFIDGARVAKNTTDLPPLTTTMGYFVRIATKAASAKNIRIKKVHGEQAK